MVYDIVRCSALSVEFSVYPSY